jgi:hypothetical protein
LFFIIQDIDFIEKQHLKLDANYPAIDFRRYQNDEVCGKKKENRTIINFFF